MGLWAIIILAIVVSVIAYGLGVYMRRRSEISPATPKLKQAQRPKATPPEVIVVPGDRETQAVVTWLLSQAFEQTGVRVVDDKLAYQRIVDAAEQALESLKTQKSVTISLPFLTADVNGPKHFETQLTREVIQELVRY